MLAVVILVARRRPDCVAGARAASSAACGVAGDDRRRSARRRSRWPGTRRSSHPTRRSRAAGPPARGRLLDELPPSEEHAWLALREASLDGAGSAAYRGCPASRARAARVRRRDDRDRARGRREGRRRSRSTSGLACMDEALAAACGDELEHPVAITFACCQLFAACGRVRDYEHAFQWCERVADLCERRNIWSVLAATRCSYAQILIARGRYRRGGAPADGRRVALRREGPRAPSCAARSPGWPICASARGGSHEAKRLVERADPGAGPARHRRGHRPRAGARRTSPASTPPPICARASPSRSCCARPRSRSWCARRSASGRRARAGELRMAELAALAAQVGRAPVVASSLVARAALDCAARRPRVRPSRPRRCRRSLRAGEAPYEAATTRIALARVLAAAGRPEDAAAGAGPGEERLRELRAQAP